MLSFGARSAGNLDAHVFKSVRDLGIVAGQAIVKSNCKVRPVLCVLGHLFLPLRFGGGPQWSHVVDKTPKQRIVELDRP